MTGTPVEIRLCTRCSRVYGPVTACPGCGGSLTLADHTFFLGKEFGKYTLQSVIGIGGMGVVYRAEHKTLNRPAAIKCIISQVADEAFLKRFQREAQVLAELKHPNIVEIYDYDVSEWGTPYFVMEYLEGETLRDVIDLHGDRGELEDYADLLMEVSEGLEYAHHKGVVHRDLKPENVFVAHFESRRVAKLLDFGIAKLMGDREEDTQLTATGSVLGTPHYLAPEQILSRELSPATDQYALALIVAEMLSGRAVREGKTLGEICSVDIRKALPKEWIPRKDISTHVRKALHRATHPDPAKRYPDVSRFMESLRIEGSRALSRPVSGLVQVKADSAEPTRAAAAPGGRAQRSRVRKRGLLYGLGILALLVCLAVTWKALFGGGDSPVKVQEGARIDEARAGLPFASNGDISVPPDAVQILDHSRERRSVVLAGSSCLYLVGLDGDKAHVRVPLNPGEKPLGPAPGGGIFLSDGSRIVIRDLYGDRETTWVRSLPDRCGRVMVSPSGNRLLTEGDSQVKLHEVREGGLLELFSMDLQGTPLRNAALGDRYLALLWGETLVVTDSEGNPLLDAPVREARVNDLTLQEERGWVALGGWFDGVLLFDISGGGRVTVPTRGQIHSILFIPDSPTLVCGGEGGALLWREGPGEVGRVAETESELRDLYFSGGLFLGLDSRGQVLRSFSYREFPVSDPVQVAARELWAVQGDPAGDRLFMGGIGGELYAYSLQDGGISSRKLHTQGITSLAVRDGRLASSSDDKTIAVWDVRTLDVIWRSRVHGFLVNQLYLNPSTGKLWSSSSDGTVKCWAWPHLEEEVSLSAREIFGKDYALAAVWVDEKETTILAGTWNGALLSFEREPGGEWKGREYPVASGGLYAASEISKAGAVLFAGVEGDHGVYLYDLNRGRLFELNDLDQTPFWTVSLPGGEAVCVLGDGVVMNYRVTRDGSGALAYEIRAFPGTDLGVVLAACLLPGNERMAAVTESGKLCFIDPAALSSGDPVFTDRLE